jgi:hypothetical protein
VAGRSSLANTAAVAIAPALVYPTPARSLLHGSWAWQIGRSLATEPGLELMAAADGPVVTTWTALFGGPALAVAAMG